MRKPTEYRSAEGDAGRAPGELSPVEHGQQRAWLGLGLGLGSGFGFGFGLGLGLELGSGLG